VARKKLEKPSRTMKDAALRTLHEVITAAGTPIYTKVSAAKALLRDGAGDDEAKEDRGPPPVLILPDNGRDPGLVKLGIDRSPAVVRIIYDAKTEAGRADLARWQAEVAAEIEAEHPTALPSQDRPRPLTGAERVRRWRGRKREAEQEAAGALSH
jgi:hypothetical protein